MLARLQESNEEQTQKLKSLQRRVEQLEETVDRQYKEIFDYRMTAQRLQVEREDLIKKLDRRGKPTE
jgi:predicted  nucleic acid-binding Zn-ribbon protein